MTDILKDASSYQILSLLIPGLIILYVRIQFLTGRYTNTADQVLYYAAVSIAYYGLLFPAIGAFGLGKPADLKQAITWLFVLFIVPAAFGAILGIGAQKNWVRELFSLLGVNLAHSTPTAWDWKFGQAKENWVLVTLKNGTRFAGFAGTHSFMSSDPVERDLLIQTVYDIDEKNIWHARASSVLITGGEISTIELWPYRTGV